MFALPQQASSINGSEATFDGLSQTIYQKIDPTTAVSAATFGQNNVTFRFTCGGTQWWIPSQTFLRVRVKLAKANGTALVNADNIAPAMNLCANLWQSCQFKVGSTIVSRVDRDVAEIHAIRERLGKTGSYLRNLGQSLNFTEQGWVKRQAIVTSDGGGRNVQDIELIWTPPLSVFDLQHNLPGGQYELQMTPHNLATIYKSVVESKADTVVGTNFSFSVEDVTMYLATVNGPRSDTARYILDLNETRCQRGQISTSTSTQQRNFEVSPNTAALSVAFQDNRIGTNSIYSPSKFRINAAHDETTGLETKLTRLYIQYASQVKPVNGDSDFSFSAGKDFLVQRYYDTLINSGLSAHGDTETIEEWIGRGAYYHFAWPRDGRSQETRTTVNFQMSADASAGSVLLFDHYQRVFQVTVRNGKVTNVVEG